MKLNFRLWVALSIGFFLIGSSGAQAESSAAKDTKADGYQPAQAVLSEDAATAPQASNNAKKPSHYFIQVQRYNIKNNGKKGTPISNVRLAVTFPNKLKLDLPENGQYWPIGNGQVQEINRTFELPAQYVENDGFKFQIQMDNKGNPLLPCNFDVVQISQFNRAYVCSVDVGWQKAHGVKDEDLDEEAIQVRVFTDINSEKNEMPKDAIALK